MAVLSKVGTVLSPTVTGQQRITGLGFRPRLIFFLLVDRNGEGTAASIMQSIGMAAVDRRRSVLDRASFGQASLDGANPTRESLVVGRVTGVILVNDPSTLAVVLRADCSNSNEDGFDLNWVNVSATQRTVLYLALGGDSFVHLGLETKTNFPENPTQTIIRHEDGFTPQLMLFMMSRDQSKSLSTGICSHGNAFGMGWALGSHSQAVMAVSAAASQTATPLLCTYQTTSAFMATLDTGSAALRREAYLTSWTDSTFLLTWRINSQTTGGGDDELGHLSVTGPQAFIGTLNQPLAPGTQTVTGVGFTPAALLMMSANVLPSTIVQTGGSIRQSIGWAVRSGQQGCAWIGNAGIPTNASQELSLSAVMRFSTEGHASPTLKASAALVSMDTDGFTLNWSTADATSRQIFYLALGPALPVWSYTPQDIFGEALTAQVRLARVALQSAIAGRDTFLAPRSWRLRYSVVTTAQCTSMAAFFQARQGAFSEFLFRNPGDGDLYRARFDSSMSINYFTPGYLAFGEIIMTQVTA